jgi:hypothetical protein
MYSDKVIVTPTFLETMGSVNGVTPVFLIYSLAGRDTGLGRSGLRRIIRNGNLQKYKRTNAR